MTHTAAHPTSPEMRKCIGDCLSCHSVCLETVRYCLQTGGRHAEAAHLQLLLDCADISRTAADFMLRGSELHQRICELCAAVAARCAQQIREHFGDDPQMKSCVDACLRAASSCKEMATPAAVSPDEMSADSFPASDPPGQTART